MPKTSMPKELKERVAASVTLLADTSLLALWVLLQWLISQYVIDPLQLTGAIDQWTLLVFQIIFASSTLVTVGTYTVKDIRLMIIRAAFDIEEEKRLLTRYKAEQLIQGDQDRE